MCTQRRLVPKIVELRGPVIGPEQQPGSADGFGPVAADPLPDPLQAAKVAGIHAEQR